MWVASGSPVCAEICAGAGFDWLLVDSEHAPNDLRSILAQLQAVAAYPVTPVIRPPSGDPVLIKVGSRAGLDAIKAITAAGKPAGVNAFPPNLAARYLRAGARFILVGADVTLLARRSEPLAARHRPEKD